MNDPKFEDLFQIIDFNQWLIGVDGVKLHSRFYFIYIFFFPIVFEEIAYILFKTTENLVMLASLVPCICYCAVSLFKLHAVISNRSKIIEVRKNVKKLYMDLLKDPNKIKLVKSEVIFVKHLIKYLFILNFVLAFVYNMSSLAIMLYHYINTKSVIFDLPYVVLLPFSTDAWIPWFIVYMHSTTCAYICIVYVIFADALYFVLVTHVCINFTILCEDLMKLKLNNFTNICNCIRSHQYIIKLSEDLDDIFKLPNFVNILFAAFQICALGFCITAGEITSLPGYLLFLCTVLAQVGTMSIFGENIILRSSKVSEAISNCDWYETDDRTKKAMLFILARSQKPQRLTALIFSTVSISNFRKILSNSWSYFSILRSVYKSPEAH